MSLLLLFGAGAGAFAASIEELVNTAPSPTHGYAMDRPASEGVWRFALELADTAAGTGVTWHDMTEFYAGDSYQRGADQYLGRYRAAVARVQVQTDDDMLAPWGDGQDTSSIFGVNVELDAGLLMRFGLFRVVSGVTVEWAPTWTGRVETWGDASAARGQIRTHVVTVTDTIADLANVPTVIEQNSVPFDEWLTENLEDASWLFGVDFYGDTDGGMLQDMTSVAAINRMDQATDPWGLVWRSRRTGRLIVHPAPWDTTNTDQWPNPLLDVYPSGLVFSFSPDFTEIAYIDDDDQQSFGIERTSLGVLNSFVVTTPSQTFALDDPVSAQRYGVRPFVTTWVANAVEQVVQDLLDSRAYSSSQALPLRTTLDHEGFWSALTIVDHLDPVTIVHNTSDDRPVVTGTGVVRNVTEDRTIRGVDEDGVRLLSWQSTVQIDLDATETTPALLPVEDLALVSTNSPLLGGPSSAEFSWTNPTQPDVTPTEVQLRVLGRSLIWITESYPGVGADGTTLGWLEAATSYTLQVRLIRRVNGVITHVSPIRQITFTTPAIILPTPDPDGTDTDVIVGEPPDFDPADCELEVELQENDGTGWVTIDTFTDAELVDNGDGTWSLATPIPNSVFETDKIYRFRSREVCNGTPGDWYTGPSFDPPEDWTDPCTTPPAVLDAPYESAIVYIPKVCAPDIVREYFSNIEGTKGDAFDGFEQFLGQPDRLALLAIPDPGWSDTPGGILAYGECPQITGVTHDKSIACRVKIPNAEDCVLFECAGMRLNCTPTASKWRASVTIYKVGVTITLPTTTELELDTEYLIHATHDYETGDVKIYVDDVLDNSVSGTDNLATISALPIWRVGAPPEAWITDCALWDSVVDFATPAADLVSAILALSPVGYWKLNESSGTVAIDSSGNGRNGNYSAAVELAGEVGPDSIGYARFKESGLAGRVSISDNANFSINSSPTGLTIFWLARPDTSGGGDVVSKGNPGDFEWVVGCSSTIVSTVWGSIGNSLQDESSPGVVTNQWSACAVQFPTVTFNDRHSHFLNGSAQTETQGGSITNIDSYANGSAPVNIGWRDDGGGTPFDGAIAHVAIFKGVVDLSTVFAAAVADGWI